MINILAAGTYQLGSPRGIYIQLNTGLTGTLIISDSRGVQGTITNPTIGQPFKYWGFVGPVSIVSNATTDATVSGIDHIT